MRAFVIPTSDPRAGACAKIGRALPNCALSDEPDLGGPALALAFKLPSTIDYPRPVGPGRGLFTVVGLPIAPRPRVAGASWSPRRFLSELPALVDEVDLDAWLAWAPAGERVAYHLGESLGADRLQDEALDLLARAIQARSRTTTLGCTAAPCGHLRALWHGSGDVTPSQRRMPDGQWLYLVLRR